MAQDATIVRFAGDPDQLMPRYAEGLRRFAAAHPTLRPQTIFVARSDESPGALVAVVLWPEGVDHGTLGGFLIPQLKELGLERPTVEHLSAVGVGFDAITQPRRQ
jgi:hypothetical protein